MSEDLKNPSADLPSPGTKKAAAQGLMSEPCPTGASKFELQADGRQVAVVNVLDDARRLRACWNACEKMKTERLEELASFGLGVGRLVLLCRQQEEELNALRESLAIMARRDAGAAISHLTLNGGAA